MRHGEIPSELAVDFVHDTEKKRPMCRVIFQPIISDVVVDHLMDDSVLYLLFRQVHTGIDAKPEVIQFCLAKRLSPLFIYALP